MRDAEHRSGGEYHRPTQPGCDPVASVAHYLLRRFGHLPRTLIARNTAFQLRPEMPDQSLDRPGGSIAKGANGVPFDFLAHLLQEVDFGADGVTDYQAIHHTSHPAAA